MALYKPRRALLLALCCAICAPVAAVPPPPVQFAADCKAPVYASDQLICSTPDLLALDQAMQEAVAEAGSPALTPASDLIEPQDMWLRRRGLCAFQRDHAACLDAAYRERIAIALVLGAGMDQYGVPLRCTGPATTAGWKFIRKDDDTIVAFAGRDIVLAAVPAGEPVGWKHFVTARLDAKSYSVVGPEGRGFRCKLKEKAAR